MTTLRPILACVLLTALAAGCDKAGEPPKPTTAAPATTGPAGQSVAPPAAMPPSDSAQAPNAPAVAPIDPADKQSQASPAELSKPQESAAMPMPGQANDHSTPDPVGKKN